jgi:hypothetical protein
MPGVTIFGNPPKALAKKRAAAHPTVAYNSITQKTVKRGNRLVIFELGSVRRRYREAIGPNSDETMPIVGYYVLAMEDGQAPERREFDNLTDARRLYSQAASFEHNPRTGTKRAPRKNSPKSKTWRLERVYGTAAGTRFAAVTYLPTGQRVDVRIRGSSDGKLLNEWGEQYPYEETRRAQIFEMADRKYSAVRYAKNPGKGRGQLISKRVLEIRYKHNDDGKWYKHSFKAGTCAALLPDGTVVLYQQDGKPVARDF